MIRKMTTNLKLSTSEPKNKKQTKQTTRTGTESQKWRSVGRGKGRKVGKSTGNKKHK